MTVKQLGGLMAPDGSQYVTLTDGAGNLASISALSSASSGAYASTVVAPGTGYTPGDSITIAGGTTNTIAGYLSSAVLIINDTKVITATLNAAGTGGTPGPVTITGTTGGTGSTKFQATGTISAGGNLQAGLVVTVAGDYVISNPTLTGEPVTGGGLTGATVNLTMGVLYASVQNPGNYTSLPPTSPATQGSTSGTGTGATFTLATGVNAASVLPLNNQNQPNSAANTSTYYGYKSGNSVTTGVENTGFGWNTLGNVTTGQFNTAVGTNAIGVGAGVSITGSNNTAMGVDALRNIGAAASNNVAIGTGTLKSTTGSGSTAIGLNVYTNATGANDNTGIGQNAGVAITGGQNVALGSKSLSNGTGGAASGIVALGYNTGIGITSASNSVILGANVAPTLATGTRNIAIGTASNTDLIAGANDTIVIGASTGSTPWLTGSLVAASPSAVFSGTVKTLVTVVASLPSAVTAGAGARAFVTDANATMTVGIGATVVGGGANNVPVYSDGTNWKIG